MKNTETKIILSGGGWILFSEAGSNLLQSGSRFLSIKPWKGYQ